MNTRFTKHSMLITSHSMSLCISTPVVCRFKQIMNTRFTKHSVLITSQSMSLHNNVYFSMCEDGWSISCNVLVWQKLAECSHSRRQSQWLCWSVTCLPYWSNWHQSWCKPHTYITTSSVVMSTSLDSINIISCFHVYCFRSIILFRIFRSKLWHLNTIYYDSYLLNETNIFCHVFSKHFRIRSKVI